MKQRIKIGADGKAYPYLCSASVDNPSSIIYVAAYNSSDVDKERADIVLTGSHDEVILNTLIEKMSNAGYYKYNASYPNNREFVSSGHRGGKIFLFPGDYIVDGFTTYQYTDNEDGKNVTKTYKCGIVFPSSHSRDNNTPYYTGEVTLEGFVNLYKESNVSAQSSFCGATIRLSQEAYDSVDASAENTEYAVIGSDPLFFYSQGFFQLKKLGFYLPENKKPIIAIDGKFSSEIGCEEIFMGTGADVANSDLCDPKCIGIRGCNSGNNGRHYVLKFIKVCGYGTGFHLGGEHLVCEQIIPQRCHFGYVFGNISELNKYEGPSTSYGGPYGTGFHNLTFINCCFEYVHYGIIFGRGSYSSVSATNAINGVTFIDLNCEDFRDVTYYATIKCCEDRGDGCFRGTMTYLCGSHGRMWDDIENGKYFDSTNMYAPKIGNTSQRPTNDVELGFKYYDTDLQKYIFRTATDWYIP